MDKRENLEEVAKEIEKCAVCKKGKSGLLVPGEGNPDAKVVFVGEAPGKQEAKTGRPFIGRSGQLLRSLIREIGLNENDVFITSVVKYLPDQGTPSASDIAHSRPYLEKQLAIIDPKIIVLLGSIACQGVLGEKVSVSQRHGEVVEKNGKKYIIMFHPAAALRFSPVKEKFKKDFKKLEETISRV